MPLRTKYSNQLFITFLSLLCACGSKEEKTLQPKSRPEPKVDAYLVKTESYAQSVEIPGTIVANEATEIHPEVSGRITTLNVKEGQFVNKGALLAKLYDADLQAQMKKLEAQLEIAKVNENRAAELVKIQGISRQEYDASALTVKNILADMEIIRTDIARTEVRAPFSGRLGLKEISPGAYVTPASVIATINQTSTLKIDFAVPEKYTSRVRMGQTVNFTVEGNAKNYTAKVAATESNVAVANRSLTVRAVVNGKTDDLIPGTFAKVKMIFEPIPDAIFIPTQAVVPTAKGKRVVLYNNGKARFNDVETGTRDSSRIEILKGLNVGDTVVVTGLMAIKPDAGLKISRIVNN